MTKNLNQALRKLNYNNNPIEQEIELLESFLLKNNQVIFSTFQLEKMIASELCFDRFKFKTPSDAVKEENQDIFIELLKETKIVSRSFQVQNFYSYSDSYESDSFDTFTYLEDIRNKFNNYAHRAIPNKDFSNLLVIQNLYKSYIKARVYYKKMNPNKELIDEPTLKEFSETIKNSSCFSLDREVFFERLF